ncbi:hypothetical protein BH11MYX4_BH11MYX4_41460 [soil metagenome]
MLRSRLLSLLPILAVLVTACGGGDSGSPDTTDAAVPPARENPCAEGFSDEARGYCVEKVPAAPCAPGTRPRIGETACVPVGWTAACPPGMLRDASGWGCIDVPAHAAA